MYTHAKCLSPLPCGYRIPIFKEKVNKQKSLLFCKAFAATCYNSCISDSVSLLVNIRPPLTIPETTSQSAIHLLSQSIKPGHTQWLLFIINYTRTTCRVHLYLSEHHFGVCRPIFLSEYSHHILYDLR